LGTMHGSMWLILRSWSPRRRDRDRLRPTPSRDYRYRIKAKVRSRYPPILQLH